jgi:tetratricopeptide (TPR) repeat protein
MPTSIPLLTRLELCVRKLGHDLVVSEFATKSGYTRQHLLRLRLGEAEATRGGILALTSTYKILSGADDIRPEMLFERADTFLKTPGQRLSRAHRDDRRALDKLLGDHIDPESWPFAVASTGVASETAVRYLLKTARARMREEPSVARTIYAAAFTMASGLPATAPELAASLQANASKGQANACRHLGEHGEALQSLASAANLFWTARYCTAEAGQVEYSRAAIFVKMELWEEALIATRAARKRFVQSRDARRIAHAELLEANILFEQGDWDAARDTWLALRSPLKAMGDKETLAMVWLNLGACEIRRNQPGEARHWLNRASGGFRRVGNRVELARTKWNIATYLATFRHKGRALRAFRHARQAFLTLEMWLDAACVGLDMTELMIALNIPKPELTGHACDVASDLVRGGLKVSAAHALDQLRRIATSPDPRRTVRVVRAALRDAEAECHELAVANLQEGGTDRPPPPEAQPSNHQESTTGYTG